MIVHNVLPRENLEATIDDIWQHTGADPNDSETWYRRDIIRPVGMVEMYHYQLQDMCAWAAPASRMPITSRISATGKPTACAVRMNARRATTSTSYVR